MDNGVEGTLEEGRVDGANGLKSFCGKSCGEEDCVFLGDTDVKELLWELLGEGHQACAIGHSSGDSEDFGILPGKLQKGVAKNVLVFWRAFLIAFLARTGGNFKGSCAVEFRRVAGGSLVALALFGKDVEDDGLVGFLAKF